MTASQNSGSRQNVRVTGKRDDKVAWTAGIN